VTTQPQQDYTSWIDRPVVDRAGEKVGKVSDIFVDDETGQAEWLALSTGLFAKRSSFVPIQGVAADGDQLVIAYDKAMVKDAPQVDDDSDGHLTPAEEQELYRYYDRQPAAPAPPSPEGKTGPAGSVTSGPTTDDAMTRSEERINVGTRTEESGRARLRKYVVTEMVTRTVPVSHEEVRIEREPITAANRAAATDGAAISEAEHEVILHAERPVVEKEVVPVERVRLATETVTGEETVTAEIRKERIEEEGVGIGD
jgi:uncharacterized protein (TIGR02271 family)